MTKLRIILVVAVIAISWLLAWFGPSIFAGGIGEGNFIEQGFPWAHTAEHIGIPIAGQSPIVEFYLPLFLQNLIVNALWLSGVLGLGVVVISRMRKKMKSKDK